MSRKTELLFFTGMHHASSARHLPWACISINALRKRQTFNPPTEGWMMDSGAFTELFNHGEYRHEPEEYAAQAARWKDTPGLQVVVAQDYMCEPFILEKTGKTVADHQLLTIQRYDRLLAAWVELAPDGPPIMPVLQGWTVEDYVSHLRQYGDRLTPGMWVGVGSVCKRQSNIETIRAILRAIKAERPDLRLHGFGVKLTALKDPEVRSLLHSADSMAWSYHARKHGRDANSPAEALGFAIKVAEAANDNTSADQAREALGRYLEWKRERAA